MRARFKTACPCGRPGLRVAFRPAITKTAQVVDSLRCKGCGVSTRLGVNYSVNRITKTLTVLGAYVVKSELPNNDDMLYQFASEYPEDTAGA